MLRVILRSFVSYSLSCPVLDLLNTERKDKNLRKPSFRRQEKMLTHHVEIAMDPSRRLMLDDLSRRGASDPSWPEELARYITLF